jgi:hypothetical protein
LDGLRKTHTTNGGTLATCITNCLDNRGVTCNEAAGGQKAERDSGSLGEKHLEPVKWIIRETIKKVS